MSSQAKMLFLPDTMANWPFPRKINPHYEEVKADSSSWVHSLKAFTTQSQLAFDKGDYSLLAALLYDNVSKEHLRTGCDLMNLFFIIDEYTDVEPAPVVREMVNIAIDALKNPHKPRPEGDVLIGEATKQFWELAVKTASPTSQKHFVNGFIRYLNSLIDQAKDRDMGTYLSTEEYFTNRRDNIGATPSFSVLLLGCDIPEEALYHPAVLELAKHATDMVFFDNDIGSYNREQATGNDRHNSVTLVMREHNLDLDAAMIRVGEMHAETAKKFIDGRKCLPTWGEDVNRLIHKYLDGLGGFVRGNVAWNFESARYFGAKGREIQETLQVPLLPKVTPLHEDVTLRKENVIIPLVDDMAEMHGDH